MTDCPFCARLLGEAPYCDAPDCAQFEADIKVEAIGKVFLEEGWDDILLIHRLDDDLMPAQAESWALRLLYRDTDTPGAMFCHSVSAIQYPSREDQCLVLAHRRLNV